MQMFKLAWMIGLTMAGNAAMGQQSTLQVGTFATTTPASVNNPANARISVGLGWQPTTVPFQFDLPLYVQENPRGYSPLCRTELLLEDRLPVAPWIHLLPSTNSPGLYRGNANVMLKVKGF